MAKRYENRYGRGSHRRDRDYADDRGYVDRATDEVRSWFGDDEAERRRRIDEQHDRERERRYGSDWDRGQRNRSESRRDNNPGVSRDRPDWNRTDSRRSEWNRQQQYGPQNWRTTPREDSPRYEDWSRTYAASDWDRDREVRDRSWSGYDRDRDRDWDDRDTRMNQFGGSIWSTDEGRAEFGPGPSTGFGTTREASNWGRGPKGYQRSDSRIHEDVCDRLAYSAVDAENIEVTVNNGEVTLSGSVRHRSDKHRAEDIAEEVSGVRDVHNSIRVQREERGIGQSETSTTNQPGSMLGMTPTDPDRGRTRS